MKRAFDHGQFANVTSVLALVVALGGTSYAAITLPKNSVGSAQIKRNGVANSDIKANAVTSAKVKNGSLLSADFKAGQIPAGLTGAQGAPGATGATGATGAKGDKGDPGTPATKLFAQVTSSGTLSSASSGATAAARGGTGEYVVTFNRDLSACVSLAEIGFVTGIGGSFLNDTIASTNTGLDAGHADVEVDLQRASSGAAADGNFNVVVFC